MGRIGIFALSAFSITRSQQMTKLSDIERMKNRPPEDEGFFSYCPGCEEQYGSHDADPETGLIYCGCGTEFEPEE